jgi:hypothetical protein
MWITQFKPAVPRNWLLSIAGAIWSIVGIILCYVAFTWVKMLKIELVFDLEMLGVLFAFLVYRWGFSRIVRKNITRIDSSPENPCLFSFQAWKSYLMLIIMITLGYVLRHSVIPKPYLSVLYTTIGFALILSSIHYYSYFRKPLTKIRQSNDFFSENN